MKAHPLPLWLVLSHITLFPRKPKEKKPIDMKKSLNHYKHYVKERGIMVMEIQTDPKVYTLHKITRHMST